jgi:hypothetical protein
VTANRFSPLSRSARKRGLDVRFAFRKLWMPLRPKDSGCLRSDEGALESGQGGGWVVGAPLPGLPTSPVMSETFVVMSQTAVDGGVRAVGPMEPCIDATPAWGYFALVRRSSAKTGAIRAD